ncbi:hypothetical protein J2W25_005678 [Variovorax boronicumulans]|uniref:Uncharacterized protein n=1 Tax=Variovorax boronicumulans TaxID=436515 RepID=A0AAW8E502_9BURK|nr:hypothetical protein [Variovorax boronicumulans]MDP9881342.1 hypothetical protein [Variovorax boronicumulans]MDP9926629.1 hypothetical protein [Variovorax boronicumulans]
MMTRTPHPPQAASQPDLCGVQLEHVFVAGIRFDTEVEYLSRSASGARYERLPLRRSKSPRSCALDSVVQCAMVLAQLPRAPWLVRVRRAARLAMGKRDSIDDEAMLRCIAAINQDIAQVTAIGTEALASGDVSCRADQIASVGLEALQSGDLCLLHYESCRSSHWCVVIGVEFERGSNRARALLLLDAGASEPWACAHNVRIELEGTAGRAIHARPGFGLSCRHLTGEACAVRPLQLIVLKRV